MPNFVAHELFGAKVKEYLPQGLQRAIEKEPEAYRCGQYGPDPLLFFPTAVPKAKLLHNYWQELSASILQNMLEWGAEEEQSFAAGYLCHLLLDDNCHRLIYHWMAEQGLSHHCLEMGLDMLILKQLGEDCFPDPGIREKKRISGLAADLLHPARHTEYRLGLQSMGLVCKKMSSAGKFYRRRLDLRHQAAVAQLLRTLDETVDSAALLLTLYHSGEMQPASGALAPAY